MDRDTCQNRRGRGDGLEGVVVAETRLSRVDGEGGRLVVRGRNVEDLAGVVPFEGICSLLWTGDLDETAAIRAALGRARCDAWQELAAAAGGRDRPAMDALRAGVARLCVRMPEEGGHETAAERDEAVRITASVGVLVALEARRRAGAGTPVAPAPDLGHAADLLRMIGDHSDPARETALDTYLATVAEHGMNASTFTARVVASTGSCAVSAVTAAIGALKGPRHGGAPGPVLDMLDAIGRPERARAHLEEQLSTGRRIMGMGHRVYRVRDPRASVLEEAVEALERAGVATPRLGLARAVEQAARELLAERHPARALDTNVEFYTAVLLDAVGLDRRLFTPVFAAGRVAGWLAHVAEQRADSRIIRPLARYVGPMPAAA